VLRVRHYGELGQVQIAGDELERALASPGRAAVEEAVRGAGYAQVEIDPAPFRSGSLTVQYLGRLEAPSAQESSPDSTA
jgi:PP-loop superfamily ATP-utilizing enzyme